MYWSPEQIVQSVYFVALAAGLIYLFRISEKGTDARRVAWFLLMLNLIGLLIVVGFTLKGIHLMSYAGIVESPYLAFTAVSCMPLIMVVGLHTVYRLGFSYRRTEGNIIIALFGVLGAAFPILALSVLLDTAELPIGTTFVRFIFLAFMIWMLSVLVRKLVHARRNRVSDRHRQIVSVFMIGLLVRILSAGGGPLPSFKLIPAEWVGFIDMMGQLAFSIALFLGILLFGEERHSIQAKLLGFLAAVFVLVFALSVAASQAHLDYLKEYQGEVKMPSLVFMPDGAGG